MGVPAITGTLLTQLEAPVSPPPVYGASFMKVLIVPEGVAPHTEYLESCLRGSHRGWRTSTASLCILTLGLCDAWQVDCAFSVNALACQALGARIGK
jgi:hypothetical protein